jgi:peptidoglycan/LPS O-acetylase OafA/YrhL
MPPALSQTVVERPSSRHITALDGWRGIAFLLVFVRHYVYTRNLHGPVISAARGLESFGWAGVDLFFVLSGFLITGILLDTTRDPHYFRNFMMRRVLRIFPLYYGVLFGLLALTPLLHLHWMRGHMLYFFYLGNIAIMYPALQHVQPYVFLPHLWSLSVEEQFYLLWPLAVYLARTPRRVVKLALWLSLGSLLLRLGVLVGFRHNLVQGMEWTSVLLPTRLDGLLYGAVAASLVRLYPLATLVHRARWALAITAAVVVAILACCGGEYTTLPMTLAGYPALAILFASILVLCLQPTTLAAHVGRLSPLRVIGRYSYGMYMYHILFRPVVSPTLRWWQERTGSAAIGGVLFLVSVLLGTLVVSVASYELYERHFLRLKRYFHYQPAADCTPPSAAIEQLQGSQVQSSQV